MRANTLEKITTVKKYRAGGASLNRMAYELAEAMLSEHTNTWKLAFIDYLIERDNIKSIKRGLNEAIEFERK